MRKTIIKMIAMVILWTVGVVLLFSEAETFNVVLITKLIGLGCIIAASLIYKHSEQ